MKSLIAYLRFFLLSFGLVHLGMQPVFAQADFNRDVVQQTQQSSTQGPSQGASRTNSAQGEEVTTQANMGALTNLLMMMGIGLLGYALYTYTPVTVDMLIAAAASVAYIWGEISALSATKDKMKSKDFTLNVREDGTTDNMQRKALEEQKRSYESLSEMLDQKSKLQKLAAVGFTAAAVAALVSKVQLESMRAVCTTSIVAQVAACPACVGTCPACVCAAAAPSIESLGATSRAIEEVPQPSSTKLPEIEAIETSKDGLIAGACTMSTTTCAGASLFRRTVMSMNPIMSTGGMQVAIGALAGVVLEKLGLGSLKGLTLAIFGPFTIAIDFWLSSPTNRAIAYGGLAAISLTNATLSTNLSGKMRDNVEKIEGILRQMDRLQNVQPFNYVATATLSPNSFLMAALASQAIRATAASAPCPDGKARNSAGRCNSSEKAIKEGVKTTLGGVEGLPEGFVSSVGQFGLVADDMVNNGGLTSGSLDAANNLLANSNAINNLSRRIKEDFNKKLKEEGKDPVDFDLEQEKFTSNLAKSFREGLEDAKGQDQKSFMTALGSFSPADNLLALEDEESGEQLIDATSVEAQVASVPNFQMPAPANVKFDGLDGDFNNNITPEDSSVGYDDQGNMQVSLSEDYEASESSEIVSNKEVSIFKVISVRYLKSGIPRLIGLEE